MKTFFSILSVPTRPESDEKIAVGLLLSDGIISKFDYSVNKLKVVKELVNESQYNFTENYLKSIEKLNFRNDENEGKQKVVNEQYIGYLSDYNNNVVTFCKPVKIDLVVDEENFSRLFEKFIDSSEAEKINTYVEDHDVKP
jgi:formate dehydrogenase assembly factor FdhD